MGIKLRGRTRDLFLLGCVLMLSGCGPTLLAANPAGGIVGGVRTGKLLTDNADQALVLADAHCRQYGRVAQIKDLGSENGVGNGTVEFDCVMP